MENNNIAIDTYFITYSNYLEFEGVLLAFRKKELFDITVIPKHIKRSEQGWWIGRKLLTPGKAKELYKNESKKVDVSCLQWYRQIELDECFNLERNG